MNKKQLAERWARQSHRSRGQAADSVDKLVYGLLKDLRASGKKDTKAVAISAAKSLPSPKRQGANVTAESDKEKS